MGGLSGLSGLSGLGASMGGGSAPNFGSLDIPGVVAHWPMDEASGTRSDTHLARMPATEVTTTVNGTAGKLGNAAAIVSAAKLRVANNNLIRPLTNSYSISLWVRRTAGAFADIVKKSDNLTIRIKTTYYQIWSLDAANKGMNQDGIPFPGTGLDWFHVVVVIDREANQGRHYKNNVRVNQTLAAGMTSLDNTSAMEFGFGWSSGEIDIDSVTWFDRAITDAEVAAIYNSGAGVNYVSPNASLSISEGSVSNGSNFVIHLVGTNTAWTAGTPGSPTWSASGVAGVTIIGQTVESTTGSTLTVNIPTGNTGILTVSGGGLSSAVPVVDEVVGTTPPTISVPASYYANNRSNFPVTSVTYTGSGLTSQVVLQALESATNFALTGVNACSRVRTISVAVRKGFSGALTQCTFGGNSTITVQPWEYYTTDATGTALTALDKLCVREYASIPNGSDSICGHQRSESLAVSGVSYTGYIIGASYLTNTGMEADGGFQRDNGFAAGPFLILAPIAANRLTMVIGDSLTYRTDTVGMHQFQGLPGLPVHGQGIGGDIHYVSSTGTIAQGGRRALAQLSMARLATDLVDFYGHNESGGNPNSPTLAAAHNYAEWTRAKVLGLNAGLRYWRMTLSPWTDANPDANAGGVPYEPWAEKFIASAGGSAAYNELIRASPATYSFYGVLDMHAVLRRGSTGDDRKKWAAGHVSDGTHFHASDAESLTVYAPLYATLVP